LLVSELGLGTITFGRETAEDDSATILDAFLDHGGNLVDTADVYGAAEDVLGRLLQGRRDRVVLATKVGLPTGGPNGEGTSRHHILASVDSSLRRLSTDWIDIYHLHCWDPLTPLEETLSTLNDVVRAGKVRYIGVSNFAGWQLAKAVGIVLRHGWEPIVSLTPQFSLVERSVERELLPACLSEGVAVLPWSPLGGGILSGKYHSASDPPSDSRAAHRTSSTASIRRRLQDERNHGIADVVRKVADETGRTPAQVALNWVLHRTGVTAPVLGVRTLAQLQDNLGAAGWCLDGAHVGALDEASAIDLGYPHDWNDAFGIRQGPKPDREVTA
jgi:aryl-alcohol dehydrogenase-like predicted oxidoreductase